MDGRGQLRRSDAELDCFFARLDLPEARSCGCRSYTDANEALEAAGLSE